MGRGWIDGDEVEDPVAAMGDGTASRSERSRHYDAAGDVLALKLDGDRGVAAADVGEAKIDGDEFGTDDAGDGEVDLCWATARGHPGVARVLPVGGIALAGLNPPGELHVVVELDVLDLGSVEDDRALEVELAGDGATRLVELASLERGDVVCVGLDGLGGPAVAGDLLKGGFCVAGRVAAAGVQDAYRGSGVG